MRALAVLAAIFVGCAEPRPPPREPEPIVDPAPKRPAAEAPRPRGVVEDGATRDIRAKGGQCIRASNVAALGECGDIAFKFLAVGPSRYMIMPGAFAGSCIEVSKSALLLGACDGAPMVVFTLAASSGGVTIASGGVCLTEGSDSVTVRPCDGTSAQEWSLDP